jgi:hypothetical protein
VRANYACCCPIQRARINGRVMTTAKTPAMNISNDSDKGQSESSSGADSTYTKITLILHWSLIFFLPTSSACASASIEPSEG